ncbi:nucleotide-binding protein, partial [Candidatus Halobonum tyrrellensis]
MLAVTGGKGGTGKTTTTLGLARALDGRTLAVDADWDLPDLHALAGVDRAWPDAPEGASGTGETDGTDGTGDPSDAVRSAGGGVSVLPAPPDAHERDGAAATLARVDAADADPT